MKDIEREIKEQKMIDKVDRILTRMAGGLFGLGAFTLGYLFWLELILKAHAPIWLPLIFAVIFAVLGIWLIGFALTGKSMLSIFGKCK